MVRLQLHRTCSVKLGKTSKEATVAYLKALSRHLPGGTDKTHEKA
jgi:hypothetical protein